MLEDSLDPRPNPDVALALLLGTPGQRVAAFAELNLARFWDDRQSEWTNLRNLQYWLEHRP
jgi:hypothetical protein